MEYVSIRTSTLRGDQKIDFDVYVQVAGKHILYLRQGDSFEGARLERLRQKKLKKMFIQPGHEQMYRAYMNQNIEMAYDKKSGKSVESRAEVIQGVQQSSAEAVMEEPANEANYAIAKEGASRYVEFLLNEEKAVQAMLNVENNNQDIAHHGVAVSTIAVAIANRLGLNQPATTQLLALGGLLHDFGHAKASYHTFQPVKEMQDPLRAEYMKHPMLGGDQARDKRHFDPAVIAIIAQHEELINGTGYPNKLFEKATDPLAVIISTANDFDRLVVTKKISRGEALKKLTLERVGLHPLNQIQAMRSVI
jgi:putative nucleotidyltransferase with HDIG domain